MIRLESVLDTEALGRGKQLVSLTLNKLVHHLLREPTL